MIKYEDVNNIGLITLNRPEKRNALNPDLVFAFKSKLKELKTKSNLRALIVTGEGKSFCAGADLEYLNNLGNFSSVENEKDSESLAELFIDIYDFPQPVIAAVNGAAIGGGCGLASVCDFVVADSSYSRFGYTEVKIGFVPAIVSIFLIKKIGEGTAIKMLMAGEIIDGQNALKIGLADYLSDNPLEEAKLLAERLSQNSGYSMILTKQLVHSISNLSIKESVDYCIRLNTISRASEDFKNGLNNFLNKK